MMSRDGAGCEKERTRNQPELHQQRTNIGVPCREYGELAERFRHRSPAAQHIPFAPECLTIDVGEKCSGIRMRDQPCQALIVLILRSDVTAPAARTQREQEQAQNNR